MTDLEQVLRTDNTAYENIQQALSLLEKADFRYAVTGAVALSCFTRARFTFDVDILVDSNTYNRAIRYFDERGIYKSVTNSRQRLGVCIIEAQNGFEEKAISLSSRHHILDSLVNVTPPEILLVIYGISNHLFHLADGIELLKSNITLQNISQRLGIEGDAHSGIERIISAFKKTEHSSYNQSVINRLKDRKH